VSHVNNLHSELIQFMTGESRCCVRDAYAAPTQGVVFIYSGGIDRAIDACGMRVLMRGKRGTMA